MVDEGMLLRGEVLFQEKGTSGYTEIGNMVNFVYSKEGGNTQQRLSTKPETLGQVVSEFHLPAISKISLTSDSFNKYNLTLLFLGESSNLTVIGASVTAESVDLVEGKWVQLANKNITSSTVAITGKIEGTDFEVDYTFGFIKALNSGAAGTQSVDYDHGGIDGYVIKVAKVNSVDGKLYFKGKNMDNDHSMTFFGPDISLKSEGDFDFFTENYAQLTLTGSFKIAEGYDTPCIIEDLGIMS